MQYLTTNPKAMLLVDGLGALLTALSIGVVLVQLERYFGMPPNVLYPLAYTAGGFAIYSLSCAFFLTDFQRIHFILIMLANTLYCTATLMLVFYFWQQLTVLGILYFLIEILIVGYVIWLEKRTLSHLE
ncbi:MAG: hypothetical protein AAF847_10315 [Bacteroidota bacterium]